MKFVADEMLGKLARWMRFMGLDVVYKRPFPDEELIKIASGEGRILLTRDTRLMKKAIKDDFRNKRAKHAMEVWMIDDDLPFDQLAFIVKRSEIDPFEHAFTRCSMCNGLLDDKGRDAVRGQVPPFVFSTIEDYSRCRDCGKIYWAGSHRSKIEKLLENVKTMCLRN